MRDFALMLMLMIKPQQRLATICTQEGGERNFSRMGIKLKFPRQVVTGHFLPGGD
jgi:hypothetical protein